MDENICKICGNPAEDFRSTCMWCDESDESIEEELIELVDGNDIRTPSEESIDTAGQGRKSVRAINA